jgi:Predicted metal-dependent membrane protease
MRKLNINQNIIIVIKSLVITITALLALEFVLSLMHNVGLNILNDSLLGNVLLELTILFTQILIIRRYSNGNLLNSLSLTYNKSSVKLLFNGVLIGLLCTLIIYSVIFLMKIGFYKGTGFKFYDSVVVISFIIGMFIRAFFAGFCEEVFFRGVLLNYLSKYKGKVFGLLVSSLIFAVFHCTRYSNLYQLSSVLLCGITLGYIYIKTKSLYMSIGLHFATDFFMNLVNLKDQPSFFVFDINPKYSLDYLTQSSFLLMSIAYISLLLILILINKNSNRKHFKIDNNL